MSERPEPLTPVGCDLQDFAFMPLDVARLRDSDLASDESPESCWAAVLLWAAAWHQVPAASIPDNDNWIAKQAGYAQRGKIAREWAAVRTGALRGWVLCSDGRLYHPVVAEKARDAWAAKLLQRWRTECSRIKKHNDRHEGANVPKPTYEEWVSLGCPQGQPLYVPGDKSSRPADKTGDKGSKREGEGQGQRDSNSVPIGTDGAAVSEATKAELWASGKSLLAEQGMAKAQCGSFVGKLCKDYGDEVVIEAVRVTVVKRAANAADFLIATCKTLSGQRTRSEPEWRAEQRARTQQAAPGVASGQPADQFFIEAEARHGIAHSLG